MEPDDFDPLELGVIFAGDDDCVAPTDPAPQSSDTAHRIASAFLKMLDPKRES
jgi:hypothetical protein